MNKVATVLLIILLVFGLSSCDFLMNLFKSDPLFRTWVAQWIVEDGWYVTFNSDGTFREDMFDTWDGVWTHETGTYLRDDTTIFFTYTSGEEWSALIDVDEDSLTLTATEGLVISIVFKPATLPETFPDPTQGSDGGTTAETVSQPIITLSSTNSPALVTIACATTGATIYYTTDGSSPDSIWSFQYTESFEIYESTTIKAYATKADFTDSDITELAANVSPVALAVGQAHDFNGVNITLDSIHWYKYRDIWGTEFTTDRVVLQYTVENTTIGDLSTNPIYAWGYLIESPGSTQLSGLYISSTNPNNVEAFGGYTILSSAVVKDACVFEDVSADATSFVFRGDAPYDNASGYSATCYFEVPFDRSAVTDVAIP